MSKKERLPPFEQSLLELEHIVTAMESNTLSLEEALGCFEKGIKLSQHCQEALKQAEQRVEILTNSKTGLEIRPFESKEND